MPAVSVCPSALVEAPTERVWDLVARPEALDLWTDGTLVAAEPPGPVAPGQEVHLVTRALGWTFAIRISVSEVDAEQRRLHLLIHLPFGIVNDQMMTLAEAGEGRTLVRFG